MAVISIHYFNSQNFFMEYWLLALIVFGMWKLLEIIACSKKTYHNVLGVSEAYE